jgi:hypothetical protein
MEGRRKMSEIKDGGAAFPYCVWVGDHHNGHNTGMSLRDWFAGMALSGILSNPTTVPSKLFKTSDGFMNCEMIANCAYEQADSMLLAGEGEK